MSIRIFNVIEVILTLGFLVVSIGSIIFTFKTLMKRRKKR